MLQWTKIYLFFLLICLSFIPSASASGKPLSEARALLKQASILDRDLSKALAELNAWGTQVAGATASLRQAAEFRIRLSRLQAKSAKLDPERQIRTARKIAGMMQKLNQLRQEQENIASADKEAIDDCEMSLEIRPDSATIPSAPASGSIAGRVTDDSNGVGIANVRVEIYDSSDNWVATDFTDYNGYYITGGLAPGTYFATARAADYVDELFEDIPCVGYCDFMAGTPIVVTEGSTIGVYFALSRGSKITGRVTDSATGLPITGGGILVYDSNTYLVSSGIIKTNGTYNAGGLPAGSYYVRAASDGYVSEYYDNDPCPMLWCDTGTPVLANGTDTVSGIDFALTKGGVIGGSLTDSATQDPINGQVEIFDELGDFVAYGYTDASGAYSVDGLPAGQYYAATVTDGIYIDQIYDEIPWSGNGYPDALSGTPITVSAPQTTQIDFALDAGGSISGTLTDAVTGLPVDGVVQVYDLNGDSVSYGFSDSAGHYSAGGLLTGTYYAVMVGASGDYLPLLYNGIPCHWTCNIQQGTPISVTAPQGTGGIDFALTQGGRISGTFTDAGSSLPLDYAYVDIFNDQGQYVSYGYTYPDLAGAYSAYTVPEGSYFMRASSSTYVSELYGNIPCPWLQCDVLTAVPVSVLPGNTTTGIDFALSRGTGSISGTIADSASGLPLPGVEVHVYNAFSGYRVGYAQTDDAGHYQAIWLPGGTYYVVAVGLGHLGQLYSGIPCPVENCDPTTGTPVVVQDGADTAAIDFSLGAAGSIHGVVTDGRDGSPIQDAFIDIFDSSGNAVGGLYTDSTGSYTVDGLPDGNYYARASVRGFYAVELFDDIPCYDESCNPLDGTPIAVSTIQGATSVNFSVLPSGGIRGIVKDKKTGAALAGLTVKILDQDGSLVLTALTGTHGIYGAYGFPTGSYFVIVQGGAGYTDQLYNGVSCPATGCDLARGTLVTVRGWRTTSPINFAMTDGSFLFSDEFDDGQLASDWTYTGPSWTESQGNLIANAMQKKASAYAEPAFAGCSVCTLDLTVQLSAASDGKVWIFGWHNGKNQIELLMKDAKNQWILKERVNGAVAQKAKGIKPISPDTSYEVRMTYDGSRIQVFVDDMTIPLISITPKAAPFGTAGMAAKYATGSFGYIHVE